MSLLNPPTPLSPARQAWRSEPHSRPSCGSCDLQLNTLSELHRHATQAGDKEAGAGIGNSSCDSGGSAVPRWPSAGEQSILELICQQIDLDCRHNRFCQQNKTTKAIHNRLTEHPVDVLDKAVVDIPPDNQTRE
jgi:hypothetical protein